MERSENLNTPDGGHIAYHLYCPAESSSNPNLGIVFLQGRGSVMGSPKAQYLRKYCKIRQLSFLEFDFQGKGNSSGELDDATITLWKENADLVINKLTSGPQILVGSSFGCWVMLLTAGAIADRLHALVGLAPAVDTMWNIYNKQSDAEKKDCHERGYFDLPAEFAVQRKISIRRILDAQMNVLLEGKLDLNCPVRLVHDLKDEVIDFHTSLRIAEQLTTEDVEVILTKGKGHSLSDDSSLRLLEKILDDLVILKPKASYTM